MKPKIGLILRGCLALARWKFGFFILALDAVRALGRYIYDNGLRMPGDKNTYHDNNGIRYCTSCDKVVFNSQDEVETYIARVSEAGEELWWYYEPRCRYYHFTTMSQQGGSNVLRSFLRWLP